MYPGMIMATEKSSMANEQEEDDNDENAEQDRTAER